MTFNSQCIMFVFSNTNNGEKMKDAILTIRCESRKQLKDIKRKLKRVKRLSGIKQPNIIDQSLDRFLDWLERND